MSNVKVKVGDRVVRRGSGAEGTVVSVDHNSYILIHRDDGTEGSGPNGAWMTSQGDYNRGVWSVVESASAVPEVESWDYAEADRLRKAALTALEAYNAYADRKPATTHYPVMVPAALRIEP